MQYEEANYLYPSVKVDSFGMLRDGNMDRRCPKGLASWRLISCTNMVNHRRRRLVVGLSS